MESLLNFNFLKDISVKKNNEKNPNDKSLLGNGKSIVINQPDSTENEFNNIVKKHVVYPNKFLDNLDLENRNVFFEEFENAKKKYE